MALEKAPTGQPSQWNASSLTVEDAIANLKGSDLGLRVYAAWWLGRFRVDQPEGIELLIAALDDEDDRTEVGGYPLRRNAARALGKLGNPRAFPPLVEALKCSDFYVREAATQSLEALGNDACIPTLVALLNDDVLGTQPAPEPPHLAQPFDAILEALGTLGATDAMPLIRGFLGHPIPRIQFSAARAMYQLSSPHEANQYGDRLVQALENDSLQLRRTVLADLGAIGYVPAAEPISQTLAENSLKLIALKGVLETHLQQSPGSNVSTEAVEIMALMDSLL